MKWPIVVFLVKSIWAADYNPDENENVHNPNLFEGDMFLTREQRYKAERGMNVDVEHVTRRKRGSSNRSRHRWQGGVLVYSINTNLASNSLARSAIREGMNEWQTKTCIRFKQRTNERDYVYFTSKDRGCYSYVGKIGGSQPINLGRRCWSSGIVAHEIAHALGFFHEQSRPDRDKYITVNYNNIRQGARKNFLIYRTAINSLGTPYDYGSIMHYGSRAFSKNGQATIVPKQPRVVIGQRKGLSPIDARQANLFYSCPSAPASTTRNPVSTEKPASTTRNPVSTKKPASTTRNPASTTRNPVSTKQPASTTRNPVSTKKPASTTRNPVPTSRNLVSTKKPASTTRNPVPTTRNPASTTRNPASTTRNPVPTTRNLVSTKKPASTTRNPVPTTRNLASTTRNPVPTTRNLASTTRNPVPTTRNLVSTKKPASTTRNPVPTTRNPAS
ncbi:zinc metalloproteinase nas-4-like isoform X7 [Acropora millepora]|uniref:zinc metalloproteinase nas-4-like isoform X7 n=1 Tax=Acropora millepora TaxID=45264 RepID=UPI001CF1CE82|nr:zinc metalloproteinase nas-4-like isoform X7 [Acropora millepora]